MREIDAALYSTLTNGTALTGLLAGTTSVYHLVAPDNAAFDYVVWNIQGGGDQNLTPRRRIDLVYWIRGYSKTSADKAARIDAAVDTKLHGVAMSVTGWNNFWLARETHIENVETTTSNEKIYSSGGLYRVRIGAS